MSVRKDRRTQGASGAVRAGVLMMSPQPCIRLTVVTYLCNGYLSRNE